MVIIEKKQQLTYIAKNPTGYLQVQGKSLETRLEKIKLDDERKNEIIAEKSLKTVVEKGLGLFGGIGDAAVTILNWNESVNEDLGEAKKMILLEQYLNKADNQEKAIEMLKDFLVNPQGNTLFNKVLRIIDDSPPDQELMTHLSSALKVIVGNGNFDVLFDQHKYALSQIERLTPQALTIISDHKAWPPVRLGQTISFGPKVTSDWYSEFTNTYCQVKGITDDNKFKRVMHSVVELQRQGFMEAFNGENDMAHCRLTNVGLDLLPYISE
ncbi:hypothetical protein [Peribacillus simplex]|uniref:hypothetical protein n=1 Tax=Peribacillus simplex TaxID=1478 RepID=UPI003CE716E7